MFRPLAIRLAEFAALGVLVGTTFSVLALRPPVQVAPCSSAVASPPPRPAPAATILDVAAGVSPLSLAALLHLAPGEHVIAIDDVSVHSDLDAGSRLALRAPALSSRSFIDIDVRGPAGPRRLLVLLH